MALIPGIAWDYVPILMGKENARKSTFVNDLAFGIWGGELSADLHNQQLAVEQMMGKWILELAEITNVKRSDAEMFKAFITRRDEKVRLSYDRRARQFPRQSVFIGTTNEHTFATSSQNRRMWPIKLEVDVIDNDKLRREITQMWAEALVEFKKRLNVLNVEVEDGASTKQLYEVFYGMTPEDLSGWRELGAFRSCVLEPLCWTGLLVEVEADQKRLRESQYFKTPLWNAALKLDTNDMLEPAQRH